MTFSAILFDLFDTLVLFDRNRLPEVQIDGTNVRSTAGQLLPILAQKVSTPRPRKSADVEG